MLKSHTNVSKEYTYTAQSKCTVYTVYFYSLALSSLLKILVETLMPVRLIWMFLFSNVEKCLQKLLISDNMKKNPYHNRYLAMLLTNRKHLLS